MNTERRQVGIELADVADACERQMYPAIVAYCRDVTGTDPTPEQLATLATVTACILRPRFALAAIVAGADGSRLAQLSNVAESLESKRIEDELRGESPVPSAAVRQGAN